MSVSEKRLASIEAEYRRWVSEHNDKMAAAVARMLEHLAVRSGDEAASTWTMRLLSHERRGRLCHECLEPGAVHCRGCHLYACSEHVARDRCGWCGTAWVPLDFRRAGGAP